LKNWNLKNFNFFKWGPKKKKKKESHKSNSEIYACNLFSIVVNWLRQPNLQMGIMFFQILVNIFLPFSCDTWWTFDRYVPHIMGIF